MKRERILAELERLQPWFHRIDLGNGVFTKTKSVIGEPIDHPAGPWQTIGRCLPEDLTGKRVLDVGCNAGFYAIEAKRRGAARVLGVDGQRQHIRQAVFVRQVLGLDIEYRRVNVYELTRRRVGQFDVTLALGLLYHLKHLVLALENLYEVTRELLVVETAIMPPKRTPEPLKHFLGELRPLAYIENPAEAKEQVFNWFLPSVSALTALLRNTGFADIEVVEVKDERAVLVCRKTPDAPKSDISHHHLASLQLVSGPTECRGGEEILFVLRVENVGLESWPATRVISPTGRKGNLWKKSSAGVVGDEHDDHGVVHLASHLLRPNEEEVAWDYARANLPYELQPGQAVEVELPAQSPAEPGTYIIEFDMVAEHIAWFEDFGSGTLRHKLTVV